MRKDEIMITAIGSTGLRPALDALKSNAAARSAAVKATTGQAAGTQPTAAAELVAAGPPVDMEKVAAIRSALTAGTYRIDPQSIADRMIADDLPRA